MNAACGPRQRVLVLLGPTASGKSALAVDLASCFDAEIVGADSRQIYRDMPIGTAAPTAQQRGAVVHHLVAFLDPRERYSAARYAQDATAAVAALSARGKRAIVVGGTGFYVRALLGRVALAGSYDRAVRERLAREATLHDAAFLHAWLCAHDRARAAALDPHDTYRVLRALEVALAGPNSGRVAALPTLATLGMDAVQIALDLPISEIDARIERRVDAMLAAGFLDEADALAGDAVAADAVGYPQAIAYLRGWSSEAELRLGLVRATRRYARRQLTWLRGEEGVLWLAPDAVHAAAKDILGWA
ncbi:MAG: tRNA (adenosine(37)-N6)-dimethylallyltransferase MiaA [Vulcanimicrobiaceae bacterium]